MTIPPAWTVEEISKFVEEYGDSRIVKDSERSAFVEFITLYTSTWKSLSDVIASIQLRGSATYGITCCPYDKAPKYKAGPPLNDPSVILGLTDYLPKPA